MDKDISGKKSTFSADLTLFYCFFDEISTLIVNISAFFEMLNAQCSTMTGETPEVHSEKRKEKIETPEDDTLFYSSSLFPAYQTDKDISLTLPRWSASNAVRSISLIFPLRNILLFIPRN